MTAPGSKLPLELLEAIVDVIGISFNIATPQSKIVSESRRGVSIHPPPSPAIDPARVLGNMALASRCLTDRCQKHLFRSVLLLTPRCSCEKHKEQNHEKMLETTVSVFQTNPRLFQHVRAVLVAVNGKTDDPHSFVLATSFLLDNIPKLTSLRIEVLGGALNSPRLWSDLHTTIQTSIYRCITGAALEDLETDGISLPTTFCCILQRSLTRLAIYNARIDEGTSFLYPTFSPPTISPNSMALCTPTSISYRITDPKLVDTLVSQRPEFWQQVTMGEFGVDAVSDVGLHSLDPVLNCIHKSCAGLTHITLVYTAIYPEVVLNLSTLRLHGKYPFDTVIPTLETLTIHIRMAVLEPPDLIEAPLASFVASHFIPVFSQARQVQMTFDVIIASDLTSIEAIAHYPHRIIDRTRNGFDIVDDNLVESYGSPDGPFPRLQCLTVGTRVTVGCQDQPLSEASTRAGERITGRILEDSAFLFAKTWCKLGGPCCQRTFFYIYPLPKYSYTPRLMLSWILHQIIHHPQRKSAVTHGLIIGTALGAFAVGVGVGIQRYFCL